MKKSFNLMGFDMWGFIERFLPNYSHRFDVLYYDLVSRYVDGEELDDDDLKLMELDFRDIDEAQKWLHKKDKKFFLEAVEAAYDDNKLAEIIVCDE